jgi:hypothetical protein
VSAPWAIGVFLLAECAHELIRGHCENLQGGKEEDEEVIGNLNVFGVSPLVTS